MPRGGKREGAGRKTLHDEIEVRDLCLNAITEVYGSPEKGLVAILNEGEGMMKKFVFEHAFGKPKEKLEHSGEMAIQWNETRTYGTKRKTD